MSQLIKQKPRRGAPLGNQNALKHGRRTAAAIEDATQQDVAKATYAKA